MKSSPKDEIKKEILMPEFWLAFGKRLAQFVPTEKINEFAIQKRLGGFRLDRVVQGKKGVDVKTLISICTVLDLSATWLLFGIGREGLSRIRPVEEEEKWDRTVTRLLQELKVLPQPEQRRLTAIAKELQTDERMPGETSADTEANIPRKPRPNRKKH